MAAFQISKYLSTGGGLEIPISSGTIDSGKPQLIYTIGLVAGPDGFPVPYFKSRGTTANPNDGPLDFRIPSGSDTYLMVFNLDPSGYDCDFRQDDAMTMAATALSSFNGRYYGLQANETSTGRYRQIVFNAKYFPNGGANYDPYNLYLRFHFSAQAPSPSAPPPMTVRYDPDIKNPGDYGIVASGA